MNNNIVTKDMHSPSNHTIIGLRAVTDFVRTSGRMKDIKITNKMLGAAENSSAKYKVALAKKREEKEKKKKKAEKQREESAREKEKLLEKKAAEDLLEENKKIASCSEKKEFSRSSLAHLEISLASDMIVISTKLLKTASAILEKKNWKYLYISFYFQP